MRLRLPLALLTALALCAPVALLPVPLAQAQEDDRAGERRSGMHKVDIPGFTSHYWQWVPDGTEHDRQRPLVVLLHYSGGTAEQFLKQWRGSLTTHGCWGISVLSTAGPGGWSPDDGPMVQAAIEHFAATYDVDRDRVFMTGHSAGAHATVMFGVQQSGKLAAVAASAGGIFRPDKVVDGATDTPVYFLIGDQDPNWRGVQRYVPAMKEAGFRVKLDLVEGLGHAYPRDGKERILNWFADQGQLTVARRSFAAVEEALKTDDFAAARIRLTRMREVLGAEVQDEDVKAALAGLAPRGDELVAAYEKQLADFLAAHPDEAEAMADYEDARAEEADGDRERAARGYAEVMDDAPDTQGGKLAAEAYRALLTGPDGRAVADELAGRKAKSLFERAGRYARRDRAEKAREYYQQVIDEYPYTSWADKARQALAGSDGDE